MKNEKRKDIYSYKGVNEAESIHHNFIESGITQRNEVLICFNQYQYQVIEWALIDFRKKVMKKKTFQKQMEKSLSDAISCLAVKAKKQSLLEGFEDWLEKLKIKQQINNEYQEKALKLYKRYQNKIKNIDKEKKHD